MDVKDNQNLHLVGENASQAAEMLKNAKNQPDFCLVKEKIMKNNRPTTQCPSRVHGMR